MRERDEAGWSLNDYKRLAARNENAAFRATVNVIRLMSELERMAKEAESRGAWDSANQARAALAETRADTALNLKAEGRSVPYIARKLGITERRVRDYLSAESKN